MPKLDNTTPAVRKFLLSVPAFWQSQAGISGWRLDAANEIPISFWRLYRKKVKQLNPNDWIVGEFWQDASKWLKGDAWDSVMNYPFCFAVWNFVGKGNHGTASQLKTSLLANYNSYLPQVSRNLMNLIDSHDTVRILTECGGHSRLRNIASILEFGWVGTPTIYYGDELGMAGGKDPDNRNPMEWNLLNSQNPTYKLYSHLVAARNASPELQAGSPKHLVSIDSKGVFVFSRQYQNQLAICAVNRSHNGEQVRYKLGMKYAGKSYLDVVSGLTYTTNENGTLLLLLDPVSGSLLIPTSERHDFKVRLDFDRSQFRHRN